MKSDTLKVVSCNCQGLNSAEKRRDVFDYLKSKRYNIYCLQDTHFVAQDEPKIRNEWGGECIFNSFTSNQRGVAILFSKDLEFKIIKTVQDENGNMLCLEILIEGKTITLMTLYGPNVDSPQFYSKVSETIQSFDNQLVVMVGDYNLVQNQQLDTFNYINVNNPRAKEKVLDLIEINNLVDPYRQLYPDIKRYTWRKSNPLKQARLDFFLVSENFNQYVHDVQIQNSYRSDHSPIVLEIKLNDFKIGKGLWKFNNSLLYDADYVKIVKELINRCKEQYGSLAYSRESIKDIDPSFIHFTINDQLFLETLLMEIRGKTISYSSYKKKDRNEREKMLMEEIDKLEEQLVTRDQMNELELKKTELRVLRQAKMQGQYVRSRVQNIEEGEKPTNYFLNLETKNFVNKTIPKLVTDNGTIENQFQILKEAKSFYQKLYTKNETLQDNDFSNEVTFQNVQKLNDNTKTSLEGEITYSELTASVKRLKNGKSPGSDGYTPEFFKFFWKDIGIFVLRSLNHGYNIGEMSVTQKVGIITCIPKGDKQRHYMKNWRPISLLNTVYKLGSSCIAERIKTVLSTLIDSDQTGFIPGRFIGENTRLIYDILHLTEERDIPGILLLIDFEKAFDSISWTFIEQVLTFFNFGDSIKHWIKTFYKNIKSAITQNCHLSDFFEVQRGCRQGDPLSPYVFLLCAEILGIMVRNNREIKGITIDDTEYLISQYADDTSLILDGSPESLDASLRTLSKFAELSGLKINLEKTKVVWIGKKRFSADTMCVKHSLEWGSSRFTLLGIKFSVDLSEIERLNYEQKLKDIDNTLKRWSKQVLSPIGKITVIKSLLISKMNHLFLTIPGPSEALVKKLASIFYSYIWEGKPDKIKRDILCQNRVLGGLKMLNIEAYIQGLKLTWIRRLLGSDSKLTKLFFIQANIETECFAYTGMDSNVNRITNKFWREVNEAWCELEKKQKETLKETDISQETIWRNENIKVDNCKVFYKSWAKAGIWLINDLLSEDGKLLSFQQFQHIFSINTNFLIYHGILSAIRKYLKERKATEQNLRKTFGPLLPNKLKIFLKSKKGSKDMYNILTNKTEIPKSEGKWDGSLNKVHEWKKINTLVFSTTKSTKLQWFQYRIIHRILGTNHLLYKMNKRQNPDCSFCKEEPETIEHLLWTCPVINDLWEDLNSWIFRETQIELPLNLELVIFGFLEKSEKNYFRNLVIILSKFYIYRTKLNEVQVSIIALKNYLRENLNFERTIFQKYNSPQKYLNYWNPWLALLN